MPSKAFFLPLAAFAIASCGVLDPGAQQRLIYGPMAAEGTRDDIARATRTEAGILLIQRGVNEPDPNKADHYISIGERLLK